MTTRYGSAIVTLPSDLEIRIIRVFDAPAALVFDVWTTPKHVRRWWGREDAPVVVCDIDLRVGGSWRYVIRTADGVELGWHGTYQEIAAPNRLVSTEVFEGYADAESLNTLTLDENNGQTVLTALVLHSSKENRDGHIDSGMEAGMQPTLDRVEDILAELTAPPALRTVADRRARDGWPVTSCATSSTGFPDCWRRGRISRCRSVHRSTTTRSARGGP